MIAGLSGFGTAFKEMSIYLVDEGGFVGSDIIIPRVDPALLSLEAQLLLWDTLESMTTTGKALGTGRRAERCC
jgi:hypothetical protein